MSDNKTMAKKLVKQYHKNKSAFVIAVGTLKMIDQRAYKALDCSDIIDNFEKILYTIFGSDERSDMIKARLTAYCYIMATMWKLDGFISDFMRSINWPLCVTLKDDIYKYAFELDQTLISDDDDETGILLDKLMKVDGK